MPKSSKRRKNGKMPKSHKLTIENTERMYWNDVKLMSKAMPLLLNFDKTK